MNDTKALSCDLHLHSTASDGSYSVNELIRAAVRSKLDLIAITDHDTLDGVLTLPHNPQTKIIPGIELSIDVPGNEIHILGLNINPNHPAWTESGLIDKLQNARADRIHEICNRLQSLGYPLNAADVFRKAPPGVSAGRLHIAEALLEKRLIPSIHFAFQELIGVNSPAYASRYKMTIAQAIEIVTQTGGLPVLAHPGLCGDDTLVQQVISAGVKGIEVFYPWHSKQQIAYYLALCKKYRLFCSGGSDFHGKPGRFPEQPGGFYCRLPEYNWK